MVVSLPYPLVAYVLLRGIVGELGLKLLRDEYGG
jgi:hypothetical protein